MEEARPIYDDRRNSPEESFTGELVDIPGARESRTRWRIDLIAEMPTPRRGIASRARFSRRTGGNVRNLPHIHTYIYIYIGLCRNEYVDDNARCTRGGGGTRVRRKQLNLVLSSLFLFRGILASSPLPPLFFLFPLLLSLGPCQPSLISTATYIPFPVR